jgi:hypothetical protein
MRRAPQDRQNLEPILQALAHFVIDFGRRDAISRFQSDYVEKTLENAGQHWVFAFVRNTNVINHPDKKAPPRRGFLTEQAIEGPPSSLGISPYAGHR